MAVKPHSDEVAIITMAYTMALMGGSALFALGYYVYSYWGAITALFK